MRLTGYHEIGSQRPRPPGQRSARHILHEIEIGITEHEPFRTGSFEVDFDSCMRALSLTIQNDAVAEFSVPDSLSESDAQFGAGHRRGAAAAGPDGSSHVNARPYFLYEFFGNLGDEPRGM